MLRAPAAARAAFVRTAAAAALLLLALLARPAAAQSEAVQVPCNLQNANVTVAYLGPAGSNRTGLLCGYTLGTTISAYGSWPLMCFDSVQPIFAVGPYQSNNAQLPARGIVFHDYLLCTPPGYNANLNPPYSTYCDKNPSTGGNVSFIVYIGTPSPGC